MQRTKKGGQIKRGRKTFGHQRSIEGLAVQTSKARQKPEGCAGIYPPGRIRKNPWVRLLHDALFFMEKFTSA
ncbi:hypothetical protein, partial [Azonexus hydrophilus]|uniref:hypothetical protein n=1 Tax=Azonexus hydrophilus TaxID=418702 RepID=UPI0019631BD3